MQLNQSLKVGIHVLDFSFQWVVPRNDNYNERVGAGAPVYFAAVSQWLNTAFLKLSGKVTRDNNISRINLRHLRIAISKQWIFDQVVAFCNFSTRCVAENPICSFA